MGLTKRQQNEFFEAIQNASLAPEEFDLNVGTDESTIRHLPSGAAFVLGGVAGRYVVRRVAGDEPVEEREGISWYRVTQQLDLWLMRVKRDVEMPDLWAQLRRRRELLAAISDDAVENRPFTDSEQRQIAEQLQELKEYVGRTYSLSESQMRVLEERLDYLIDAARRAGRRDWLLMVAGVMLSYVLAVELPPEAARAILDTFLKGISRILGREFPELPGG